MRCYYRRDHLMSETLESYRPRSLSNLHLRGGGGGHEAGHSVSMMSLSERFTTGRGLEYDTQSLDRRRLGYRGGQMNLGYVGEDTGLSFLSEAATSAAFTSFGGSAGSKQSLGQISGVSDSPEKYRDIAL